MVLTIMVAMVDDATNEMDAVVIWHVANTFHAEEESLMVLVFS